MHLFAKLEMNRIEWLLLGLILLLSAVTSIFSHWFLLAAIGLTGLVILLSAARYSAIFTIFVLIPLLPLLPESIHGLSLWFIPLIPFGVWIFRFIITGYNYRPMPRPVALFFSVFLLVACISTFQSINMGISLAETVRYFSLFIFLFAMQQFIVTETDVALMTRMIIFSTLLMALIALPEISSMNFKDIFLGDISKNRLASFHGNPNNFAIPFLFSIPALFTQLLHPINKERHKTQRIILYLFITGLFLYIVLLTNSRSALLCLFVSMSIILSTTRSGRRLLILGIAAVLAVIPFIWDLIFFAMRLQRGLSGRDYLWKAALAIIQKNPILGIGPGNFEIVKIKYILPMDFLSELTRSIHVSGAAHNTYLSVSAELGLFASISLITFLIYSLIQGVKSVRTPRTLLHKQHSIMAVAILGGFMTRSLFETGIIIGSGWIGDNLYFLAVLCIIYFKFDQYK